MPRCRNCGQENPDIARFCLACATPLVEEPPARELRKTVTVLFCDLAGSTSMGERTDSESLRRVMARYYEEMRGAVGRHGGTVEKFIGDAVMAVFGVPRLHEDDALRAVRAAADMGTALAHLNEELERRWGVRLTTRSGVNTGEVVAGDPARGEAFVVGDTVNVAARLEQAAPAGGVLIGAETYRLVRDAVQVEAVEPLVLKGKAERVPAFRLLGVSPRKAGSSRRIGSPLVGRERELGLLGAGFERSLRRRRCELVTVLGAAGVGKSRLIDEFVAATGERAQVLRGRCLPYGEGITYWPVAEVVRQAGAIDEDDSPASALSKLDAIVPAGDEREPVLARLAGLLGLAAAGAPPEEIAWALRRLLELLASDAALVVVFDDVQWGEATFFELIEYLAGHSRSAPILLVCLARPELREVRASLAQRGVIVLEPLAAASSRVLIENLLGASALADELFERITGAAQGNPLFVEEMLRMLVDDGLLRREDGRWRVSGELAAVAAPPSIQALLAARIDRLGVRERGVLESAAVIGQEFWRGAVAELSDGGVERDIGSHLGALVERELVRRGGTALSAEEAYRFGHLLIRDVAYGGLLKETRAELHERFADWLERRAGERLAEFEEIVGYHLEQAYRYREALGPVDEPARALARRAAERLGAAGRRAFARSDVGAAVNLLERAATLLPARDPWRLELLVDAGTALTERGELERAGELLAEVLEAAEASGERRLRFHALVQRSFVEISSGSPVDGYRQLARDAVRAFEEVGDELGLARAWMLLGTIEWYGCEGRAAAASFEHALSHARPAGGQSEEEESLGYVSAANTHGPTPADEAIARCERFLTEHSGWRRFEARVLAFHLSRLNAMQGRFDEARALYARGQALLADLGLELQVAGNTQIGGVIEMLAGDPLAAERELRRGYDMLERMGEKSLLSTNAAQLAQALEAQGRDAEAERFVEIARATAAGDDLYSQIGIRATEARLLARRGAHGEAERLAREALELTQSIDFYALRADARLALADVLLAVGRKREATSLIEAALAVYEAKGDVASADRAETLLGELV